MDNARQDKPILSYLTILLVPIAGMAVGVGLSVMLGRSGQPTGNLIVNTGFFLSVLSLIPILKFSWQELGLKLNTAKINFHITSTLAIFIGYMLFYIFVIRISNLKPLDTTMIVSLLTYLIVVVAEEVYFRGQLYSYIEKRFSASTALIVSALLFGLFHARQGMSGIILKSIAGLLWGSVRYSTGMIYLLIFPVHFAFNATWLLFEGNWNTPPVWVYIVSIGEIILTFLILFIHRIQSNQITNK
jgi:membrane protease YdiL (CAAX protease family)